MLEVRDNGIAYVLASGGIISTAELNRLTPCERPDWATPGHDDYGRPEGVWDALWDAVTADG